MRTAGNGALKRVIVEATLWFWTYVTSRARTARIICPKLKEELHSY